ncbi:hypothetical protein HIM_12339 [Hirsutella minnesotensis 3608]|uniref:Uncharacterized protein n=1 Tax=Hirsutella minnesotensis 3608 TaxID=1043627 RepID=A0A0F7ZQQ4_9HYPO|nr:hypothetical protein HIM_12339 [Hirsutella minnesotensis 3608]
MTIDALEHQKSKKALSPLAPRAHIGYLVGYRASTQYVVWIPSIRANKVMTTSNVQFDEDQAFDPKREENAEAFQVYAYDILRDLAAVDVGEEEIPEKLGLSSDPFFETSSLLTIGAEKSGGKDSTEIKVQERNGAKATHQGTPGPTYPTPPTSGTRDAPNIAPEPETPRVTQEEGDEQLGGEESGFSPQSSTPDDAPQDTIQLSLGTPIRDDSIDPGQDLGGEVTRELQALTIDDESEHSTNTPDTQSQRKKRDTSEGINQANILPGKRARRPRLTVNYVMAKASTHKLHIDEVPPAPRSHSQARESEHWLDWEKGMSKEIEAHKTNGTWQTVPKKQVQDLGYDLLPVKWVYDYKTDEHGFIKEFKARLVVRGNFEEDLGQDTYAATLKGRVFRLLTALGCAEDYETEQYDVKTAFLNTYLEEAVYCHGPTGYSPPGTCLKLIRGLYGLRIAPKLWYERLSGFFRAIGATRIEEDTCVWIREGVIVFFFVDDIVMMYHKDFTKQWKVVHEALMKEFNIKYLGELRWFLGIEVIRDRPNKLLWLSQESYISKIANKFHIPDRDERLPMTPITNTELTQYTGTASKSDTLRYLSLVGSILYPAITTRPDVAFAAARLAQFSRNPGPKHIREAEKCISYLYNTRKRCIRYSGYEVTAPLFCASDSSFADDPDNRKSSQGYVFLHMGGPVDWKASKQDTVTTSSTEAELLSMSFAAKEQASFRRLLTSLGIQTHGADEIWCDNLQTLRLVTQIAAKLKTNLKHVDVHRLWLRQEVQTKRVKASWVQTNDNPADGMTKALPRQKHEDFVKQLGLTGKPTENEVGETAYYQ